MIRFYYPKPNNGDRVFKWCRILMPIYEYQCPSCGHKFELRQGFDAESTYECGVCGALAQRRISLVPVIFKGKGWYVNDYGRGNSAGSTNRETENSSTSPESPKGDSNDGATSTPKETESPKTETIDAKPTLNSSE